MSDVKKRGFLERHGIVRSSIREDIFLFGIPALLVFSTGVIVSARDGWEGLPSTLWRLIRHPRNLITLPLQQWVGLALILIGFTLLFVSLGTLKRNYASTLVVRRDHRLITHGIYRFVRHPLYLGVILITIGVPTYAYSLRGLLIMLLLIPIFLNRIRMEEKLLTEEFGEAYLAFKKVTKKLVPFIY